MPGLLDLSERLQPNQVDEQKFVDWITKLPWYSQFIKIYGGTPNLNDANYDYRAAFKAGIKPTINPYDNQYHWPSQFKSKDHPTAWKQDFMDKFTVDPDSPDGLAIQYGLLRQG